MKQAGHPINQVGFIQNWSGPLATLCASVVFLSLHFTPFRFPSPFSVLLLLTILSAFLGGTRSGMVSALISCSFLGCDLQLDSKFFSEPITTWVKLLSWIISAPSMVFMMGILKKRLIQNTVLSESERKFREITSTVPQIFWSLNPKGRFDSLNDRWNEYTGLHLKKVDPFQWQDAMHADDFRGFSEYCESAIQSGGKISVEIRLRRHDGLYRWHMCQGSPILDQDGKVVQWFGTATDIEDFKKTKQSIHDERARLSAIISTQFEIAKAGPELNQLMDLIAERTHELCEGDGSVVELIDADCMVYRAATGKAASSIGFRMKMEGSLSGLCAREGILLYCKDAESDPRVNAEACRIIGIRSMIVVPLRNEGKVVGVLKAYSGTQNAFSAAQLGTLELMAGLLGVAMSTASEFESTRKARDWSDRVSKVKSEFLANMSHEIRTPINGVMGMTELLLGTGLDAEQREFAEIIQSSASSLLVLINDILDFSKMEAGKLDIEKIDFSLDLLLLNVERTLSYSAAKKGLEFFKSVSGDLNQAYFTGDPARLTQVLTNLINNAVKFTTRGHVALEVVPIQSSGGTTMLKFEVIDTGIGIPKDQISKMFQVFSQADTSTSRRYGGTGLGLSICRNLVALMGGEIGVNSTEGRGSSFWFTVPLMTASEVKKVSLAEEVFFPKRERLYRILLAEDNLVNQKITRKLLEKYSFEVDVASDGLEAIDRVNRAPYDLVLMDCQMPELDGYEATRHIRNHIDAKIRNIPIIALTAHALVGDREKCLEAGMSEYVTKPIQAHLLFAVISSLLFPEQQKERII